MGCFLVPATEAVITTIATKIVQKREAANKYADITRDETENISNAVVTLETKNEGSEKLQKLPFSAKMKWLNKLLWGGSGLLAFEHIWHGEVTPWFPFLTAAGDPDSTAEMLNEMSTVGVSMAALVTLIWGGMVLVSSILEKKPIEETGKAEETSEAAE